MKLEQTLNILTIELSFQLLHKFHPFPKQKAAQYGNQLRRSERDIKTRSEDCETQESGMTGWPLHNLP